MNRETPSDDDRLKNVTVNIATAVTLLTVLGIIVCVVALFFLTAFDVIHPFGIGEVCQ